MEKTERTYETFVEELRKELIRETGCGEEEIYFAEKGSYPALEGDRLIWELHREGDIKDVFAICTQEIYKKHKEGAPMDEIIQNYLREAERAKDSGIFARAAEIKEYRQVEKMLILRLRNKERESRRLTNAVCRYVGDIAVVLYIRLGKIAGAETSMMVNKAWLDQWGKTEEELFSAAMKNLLRFTPPRIYDFWKLAYDAGYEGEDFMDISQNCQIDNSPTGNCLSTTSRTNGAAAIFVPEVAKRICQMMGNGYYLAFTSVHEVMVHDEKSTDPERLRVVLEQTLEEVTPVEDRLTTRIYHYDQETGYTMAI